MCVLQILMKLQYIGCLLLAVICHVLHRLIFLLIHLTLVMLEFRVKAMDCK